MSYYFHPAAEAEHLETIVFYESRQVGLGLMYLTELEKVMDSVVRAPQCYRVERKHNIRSISLKQFPFKIIFRDAGDVVQVLAVAHKRRRPDYWLKRIS
jgi:plasmid stabilization system protein ParE